MLKVIAKFDDVGNCLYMFVMFYPLSLNVDLQLIWLSYVESGLPSYVCKSSTQFYNPNSWFTQWGQLIVWLTYRVRETFQGQCPATPYY